MLGDRWSAGVPDEFSIGGSTDEVDLEAQELHSKLRLVTATTRDRQKEALEKYGVGIDTRNELRARLNLLTDMFIGTCSPERLRFELQWQKMIAESIEDGIATAAERQRAEKLSKNLHLPNGRVHKVAPELEQSDDEG